MLQSLNQIAQRPVFLMNLEGGMPDVLALEKQGEEGPPGSHGGSGPQTNPWTGKTSGGSGGPGQEPSGPMDESNSPSSQQSTEVKYEDWYNWQEMVLGGHTDLDF